MSWTKFKFAFFRLKSQSFDKLFQKARAFFIFLKSAGKANIFHLGFLQKASFLPLKVKISKKLKKLYAKI